MDLRGFRSRLTEFLHNRLLRGKGLAIVIAPILVILLLPVFILEESSKKEANNWRQRLKEFSLLGEEYKMLKMQVDEFEPMFASAQVNGVNDAMNESLTALGLNTKMKSIKEIGSREVAPGLMEEKAEVQIEKVSLNEMVNIFFRLKETLMVLSIKGVTIKKSFQNPGQLDFTMTVALLKRK